MGEMLAHYRVVGRLGRGGMGEVYLAEDTKLERKVAVKVLPPQWAADEERRRRFAREAKAASALSHANIAHIYEIGEWGGVYFISMEYVEGDTLAAKVREGPLEIEEVAELGRQIASALEEAHAKGVTHRDIKPGNIMVTAKGQAKVLDFGLAKLQRGGQQSEEHTTPGMVMGTVKYMSPEQACAREVDHRTDIYSLGAVLYEMATGRAPFQGGSDSEVLVKILKEEPEPVRKANPKAPPELERIIRKCMDKEPGRRYQTAGEVEADLERLGREDQGAERQPRRRWRAAAVVLVALAVALAGLGYYRVRSGGERIDSLAVLPLENASADAGMEYLSDGITESLINGLSQVRQLRVMSRGAVFRYKGKQADPKAVGRALGVRAVLTGRVALRGEELEVGVELVDARDDRQIWGERYRRKMAEMLGIQEEIAHQISSQLQLRLTAEEKGSLAKRHTEDIEAYDLYLRGRYELEHYTREGWLRGTGLMHQAIAKDPGYGLAYAGLADAYGLALDWFLPAREAAGKMKSAALKALEADKSLPEAHTWLAMALLWGEWDWAGAEKEFRRAMELNPRYARGRAWYSYYLAAAGRFEEAAGQANMALELDPKSAETSLMAGIPLFFARRHEEAAAQFSRAIEMDATQWWAHMWQGLALAELGRHAEAIAALGRARQIEDVTEIRAGLGYAYARAGKAAEARSVVAELMMLARERPVPAGEIAVIYAGLGEKKEAIEWLARSCEERSDWAIWLGVDPRMDKIRGEARFQELLRQLKAAGGGGGI